MDGCRLRQLLEELLPQSLPVMPTPESKHAFFLAHQGDALRAYTDGTGAFKDGGLLLKELRTVFEWMAEKEGVTRLPKKQFVERLPFIDKKFPQLSSAFQRMDYKQDAWLDFEEFARFCLGDDKLTKDMKKAVLLTVYGIDGNGHRTYKDQFDLHHICETGVPMPLLPWETCHVVEWRIEGLALRRYGRPVTYGGMTIEPGTSIASPPFKAAGVCGYLRFWPAGYWTDTTRRKKAGAPPWDPKSPFPEPGPWSWCCLGACFPRGVHLTVKYFINDETSQERECFWIGATNVRQLWAPPAHEPPELKDGSLVVGVEISRNHSVGEKNQRTRRMACAQRLTVRPPIRELDAPVGSVLLGRPRSLPALPEKRRPSSSKGAEPPIRIAPTVKIRPGSAFALPSPPTTAPASINGTTSETSLGNLSTLQGSRRALARGTIF